MCYPVICHPVICQPVIRLKSLVPLHFVITIHTPTHDVVFPPFPTEDFKPDGGQIELQHKDVL